MNEFLYFFIGFGFGIAVMLNRKKPNPESIEQVDEKLRNELSVARNLNQSLLQDKRHLQEENWKLKQEKK